MRGFAASIRTSSGRSRRSSGSPPVRRTSVDAERSEHFHQPRNFLECQQFLPRQPDVILLRHAVVAAQVAAVGDRDAQAAQRPAKLVGESAARRHSRVGSGHREALHYVRLSMPERQPCGVAVDSSDLSDAGRFLADTARKPCL